MLQVLQLFNDLYVHLMDELKTAMADLAAAQQQQQQNQSTGHPESTCSSSRGLVTDSGEKLLQLAAECEAAGDVQRSHALHQRRLLLLQSAEVGAVGNWGTAFYDLVCCDVCAAV